MNGGFWRAQGGSRDNAGELFFSSWSLAVSAARIRGELGWLLIPKWQRKPGADSLTVLEWKRRLKNTSRVSLADEQTVEWGLDG
jgi:hypothetical protein